VDCFDVTAGIYDSIEWIYTLQGVSPGALIPLASAVKGVTNKPVIGVSRLGWDLEYADEVLRDGKIDLVAIGRSLLADPHLVKKTYEGRTKEIRRCIACNECVAMENKGWQIHCIINPMLSNEYLNPVRQAGEPKEVVIIGAGPAGMECALTSAQRGHEVTVIEKSSQVGGQLLAAGKPAYKKQEFEALIGYYSYMMDKLGVKVRTNKEINEELPGDLDPDVVIIATGALTQTPKFKGGENTLTALEVLLNEGKDVLNNVVVIGASGVGIDVALFLMEKEGRKVTVVKKLDEIGGDVNEFLKQHTISMAQEKNIEFLTNSEVTGVDKGKVHIQTLLGEKTLECDSIVSAVGFLSRESNKLRKSLEKKGMQVFVIGSAEIPGKIFQATQAGFWTAVDI
jgi:2,4-dienoyl-CoA reductase (NADPH2)